MNGVNFSIVVPMRNEEASVDELVGKKAPDFYVNPADRTAFVDMLKKKGSVDGFAALLRAVDGTTFWSLLSARTIELEGARVFMVGFALLMMLMVTVIYNDLTRIAWVERFMPWRN